MNPLYQILLTRQHIRNPSEFRNHLVTFVPLPMSLFHFTMQNSKQPYSQPPFESYRKIIINTIFAPVPFGSQRHTLLNSVAQSHLRSSIELHHCPEQHVFNFAKAASVHEIKGTNQHLFAQRRRDRFRIFRKITNIGEKKEKKQQIDHLSSFQASKTL